MDDRHRLAHQRADAMRTRAIAAGRRADAAEARALAAAERAEAALVRAIRGLAELDERVEKLLGLLKRAPG